MEYNVDEAPRILVSFGPQPVLSPTTSITVLSLDEVPFLAIQTATGETRWLEHDIHVESLPDGELVVTLLYPSLLPLIRYRTGMHYPNVL